jgi:hexosaminidase
MNLTLLPSPRQIHFKQGLLPLDTVERILIAYPFEPYLEKMAESFRAKVKKRCGRVWPLVKDKDGKAGIDLCVSPDRVPQEQGYILEIGRAGIRVAGHDEAGLYYGLCTLYQVIEQAGDNLPCLRIDDWPDFPVRGVMLDISRDKVPTMETLFGLIEMLSGWKLNQLQLYMEHTFAYQGHPEVWAQASPLTGGEIRELDAFCRERYVELVPNQNSFGHMNRWLALDRYAPLAEVRDGFEAPWGKEKGPFSLCPVDPQSLVLINSLYDELLPHFSSLKLNVGCDETYDLGQGRSKTVCEEKGRGRVYLDFLLEVYAEVKKRGRTMLYWGDMVQEHPELVSFLPKDAIALEWGYEADHPFADHCASLQANGVPFYVCPGTSAWSSIAGRSDNALRNLLNAAEHGRKNDAKGYLITDWGDNGHWQQLPVSYLGFAAGAAYSWSVDSNREIDIPQALNRHAFFDRNGVMGNLAYALGNIYQATGIKWVNASVLSAILQRSLEALGTHPKVGRVPFEKVLEAIGAVMQPLEGAELDLEAQSGPRPDLYRREFELAARMMRHACQRGILAVESYRPVEAGTNGNGLEPHNISLLRRELNKDLEEIIEEYERLWLSRNRPGGLPDSTSRLKLLFQDYR